MNRRQIYSLAGLMLMLLPVIGLWGCSNQHGETGRPKLPEPEVSISQVSDGTTVDYADFTGRTSPVKTVDIKARATGYLEEIFFKDGDMVKQGQLLYRIDDRTYKAVLNKAESDIKNYQALVDQYTADLNRARRMRIGEAMSREEYDKIVGNKESASAQMAAAKAAAERAKLNVDFTKVTAPISGKISKTLITEGNLVTQDQTLLTNIVSVDPIYADFDVDEMTVLRINQMIREEISLEGVKKTEALLLKKQVEPESLRKDVMKLVRGQLSPTAQETIKAKLKDKLSSADFDELVTIFRDNPKFKNYREAEVPVSLATGLDKGFPHKGKIDFVDNQINPGTGTLRVRGVFDNARQLLQPGLFVRLRLVLSEPYKALLVSETALGSDQGQRYLYVVDKDNKAQFRAVEVGPLRDGMRVITSGIKSGEWVIVEGVQRVRPGAVVSPTKIPMPTGSSSSTPIEKEKPKDKNKS